MLPRDRVVTFERAAFSAHLRPLGYVSGIARRKRSPWNAAMRSLGMLVGLLPEDLVEDHEALRNQALDAILRRAERLGADAVVGLRFHASESADGASVLVAFGEAVRLAAGLPEIGSGDRA